MGDLMSRDNLTGLSIDDLASGDIDKPDDFDSDFDSDWDSDWDDFVYENMCESWGIDDQKDKGKNSGLFRDVDNLAGENMSINNIPDKQSDATDKLKSDAHKSTGQSVNIPDKQSDTTDKLNANSREHFQSSFMLNQPAVNGVFSAGYVLCNLRLTIKDIDHVIVLGADADNIDSTYERFKSFGAEMQSDGSKSFTISYGDGYIFVGSNNDGKVDYINVVSLEALKVCYIPWYKYGDTLDSFIERHGEPGDRDRDNGVDCITYYGDSTYKQTIQLSASDGHIIDEVAILFK